MQKDPKYEIIAQISACLLSFGIKGLHYSFVLRIGSKQSRQSSKKELLFGNTLEFNQTVTLLITQYEKSKVTNCEIILFQYKNSNQKNIAGIASVAIKDLKSKSKREIRIFNSFDKKATLELRIYECESRVDTPRLSKPTYSYQSINRQGHLRNLSETRSLIKINETQPIFSPIKFNKLSQPSESKTTLPNDSGKYKQLSNSRNSSFKVQQISEAKFQQKVSKIHDRFQIDPLQRKLALRNYDFDFHEIDQALKKERIVQRPSIIKSLRVLDSEQEQMDFQRNMKYQTNRKKQNFSIHTIVSEKINFWEKKPLKISPQIIQISINFDEAAKRMMMDRETNTDLKILHDFEVLTDRLEQRNQHTQTLKGNDKLEVSIQTQYVKNQCNQLSSIKQEVNHQENSTQNLKELCQKQIQTTFQGNIPENCEKSISRQFFEFSNKFETFIEDNQDQKEGKQNDEKAREIEAISKRISSQERIYQSEEDQLGGLAIMLQSTKMKPSLMNRVDAQKAHSNNAPNLQFNFHPNQSRRFQSLSFSENSFHNSEIDTFFNKRYDSFSIVNTVQVRIRLLKQQNKKSFWNSIQSIDNPTSTLQKVGFIKKSHLTEFYNKVTSMNDLVTQTHKQPKGKQKDSSIEKQNQRWLGSKEHNDSFGVLKDQNSDIKIIINQVDSEQDSECYNSKVFQDSKVIWQQSINWEEISFTEKNNKEKGQGLFKLQKIQNSIDLNFNSMRQANEFLQKANSQILSNLRQTKQSLSSHLFSCKEVNVSKQEHQKVVKQLEDIRIQLKKVCFSQFFMKEEKNRLLIDNHRQIKQIQSLTQQLLKVTENFKTMRSQYQALASEMMQRQEQGLKKEEDEEEQHTNKSNKSMDSYYNEQKTDIFTITKSKFIKTESIIYDKQPRASPMLMSKTRAFRPQKSMKNSTFEKSQSIDVRGGKMKRTNINTYKQKQKQKHGYLQQKQQFEGFFRQMREKSQRRQMMMSRMIDSQESQILGVMRQRQKQKQKRMYCGQAQYLLRFPSTVIEDLIGQGKQVNGV